MTYQSDFTLPAELLEQMSACQFWGAECEKIGLSEKHTGGSPNGEQRSETSPAFSQSSRSD